MDDLTILIPCYNVEKCLDKTLESVLGKAKVILVDDGSNDNTKNILKNIKDKDVEVFYNKENMGLAETRNILVSKVKTKYFTFLDAGDYLDLNVLDKYLFNKDYDLISYNLVLVNEEGDTINIHDRLEYEGLGEKLLESLIKNKKSFDSACSYIYKTSFFKDLNIKYLKGYNHEDFGVTPFVILKAGRVLSLNKNFYYYVQDSNSITRGLSPEKKYNNALGVFKNAERLITLGSNKIYLSFIANALVSKIDSLEEPYKIKYIKKLNSLNIHKYYLNTPKGIIKKILYLIKYRGIK